MTRQRLQQAFGENYMMCCCSYGISQRELIYFHWQGNPILQRALMGEKRQWVGSESHWGGWSYIWWTNHRPCSGCWWFKELAYSQERGNWWNLKSFIEIPLFRINQLIIRLADGHQTSHSKTGHSGTKWNDLTLAIDGFKICSQILWYFLLLKSGA